MNKEQNIKTKESQEKMRMLEIENALLKQRIENISNIAKVGNPRYETIPRPVGEFKRNKR